MNTYSTATWLGFNLFIVAMLLVDLFFHRGKKEETKTSLLWSAFWIGLALAFNLLVYKIAGKDAALDFLTGYLIEKSLSLDNLFVFLILFSYFKTPEDQVHTILFWGVLGAIIMRACFIFGGIALVTRFGWLLYVFGAFLVVIGVQIFRKKEREVFLHENAFLLWIKKLLPVTQEYYNGHFFIREKGKLLATPLLVVLLAVETTDLIFAIDSIPAILAITLDPFIVYTSNIFAILGLRSLFFALSTSLNKLAYLHYAIGTLLAAAGIKLLIAPWIHIPTIYALSFTLFVILVCILASLYNPKKNSQESPPKSS